MARLKGTMLASSSDEHLAQRAGQGDNAALDQLLTRHYDRLHGFCWRLVGPPPACEDLCHEVCLRLTQALPSFQGAAKFTTWAYAIALNLARDLGRKQSRQTALMAAYQSAQDLAQADQADAKARAAWLRAAIWNLPEDQRETLVLVLEEGLTQAEAAQVLGIKEGTVAWRLSQARQALKLFAAEEEATP